MLARARGDITVTGDGAHVEGVIGSVRVVNFAVNGPRANRRTVHAAVGLAGVGGGPGEAFIGVELDRGNTVIFRAARAVTTITATRAVDTEVLVAV